MERMFDADSVPTDSVESCNWLRGLWESKYQYHLDDNPRDVLDRKDGTPFCTEEQAVHLEECLRICTVHLGSWDRVWEVYYRDPIEA